jgi:DNA-binding beta-propeller fold protein YncE
MPKLSTLLASAFVLAQFAFDVAAQTCSPGFPPLPPAPPQKIAVNALTSKVYTANYDADTVTVFNAATGASTPIAVGDGPQYLAVNPATNRVYVNNARAASLSVIDGATDTLIGTFPIGSTGPIAVNPVTNVVYVVRLTGTGTDEVSYFNGNNNSWYTIAVQSHQPVAVATNPVTDKIFIAAYATGNVSIIDGAFNPNNDHPTPSKHGVWCKPVALAVNAITNKVFILTESSQGPVAVLDANTLSTQFLLAGTAKIPKAVAVNPVTNKAYALFSNELVVIDGSTLATTTLPVADAGTGAASLGVNTATNRILVATATGALTIVDGSTFTVVGNATVPTGTSGIAINAATGTSYYFDSTLHAVPRAPGEAAVANPITTSITPLAGNASGPDATLTLNASNAFSPGALPIRKVYYQVDGTTGPWIAATGTGPYSAALTGLTPGSHTLYAFAVDGLDAPLATGAQSSPLVGTMASYTFTVTSPKVDPSLSLGSSSNPSTAGTTVTFTASVSGSNGVPTGTVTFRDAATTLCANVAIASGSATCATAALSVGTHDITAQYSGDASYNARVSGVLQQQVNQAPPVLRTLTVSRAGSGSGAVSSAPAGIDCGADCGESYPNGTSVTLSATASATSDFAGWSGACTGTGACVLTMDAAKAVTATFTLKSHTVTPSAGANGALSPATPQTVAHGATTSFTVTPSAGYSIATVTGCAGSLAGSTYTTGPITASCTVSATFASVTPSRMANLSTRGQVLTGDEVMIGGFVIGGSASKRVAIVATGPSLTQHGVANPLANPMLRLVRSSDQAVVATNDDWQSASNAAELTATGFAPAHALEAAILIDLAPGAYTAIVQGAGDGTGVAVIGVYEVDHPENGLANISTRGKVLTGDGVMIGGFVISGSSPRTVAIVATGPSLAGHGVPGPLANPSLKLVRSSDQAVIELNDDWQSGANAAQLAAAGFAPADSREAAIYVTLPPGAYTAIVEGVSGATGIAVVGVYAVP